MTQHVLQDTAVLIVVELVHGHASYDVLVVGRAPADPELDTDWLTEEPPEPGTVVMTRVW